MVYFPVACGQCGGAGCEDLLGGATACRSGNMVRTGEACSDTVSSPCIIGSGNSLYTSACSMLAVLIAGRVIVCIPAHNHAV